MIRLGEEMVEKVRLRKVNSGEWTEHESMEKLQEFLNEAQEQSAGAQDNRQVWRDYMDAVQAINELEHPESIFEREYFFDETLGQSLDEHLNEMKDKFPGTQVFSRRDKEGFAVIKMTFNQEYKYNLNDIEEWDKDAALNRMHANQEHFVKEQNPSFNSDVSQEDLAEELKGMLSEGTIY